MHEKELFENEIAIRVQQELDKIFTSTNLVKIIEDRNKEIEILRPKADAYDHFLNSDGEVDCSECADAVKIFYINPQGKKKRMGNNYFIQVLKIDKIIRKEYNGYNIYASHKDYGRTRLSAHNGFTTSSVLFNKKGLDYLVKKYSNDNRIWRADNGKLTYTVGLQPISRAGKD